MRDNSHKGPENELNQKPNHFPNQRWLGIFRNWSDFRDLIDDLNDYNHSNHSNHFYTQAPHTQGTFTLFFSMHASTLCVEKWLEWLDGRIQHLFSERTNLWRQNSNHSWLDS
jgi:hypothetical protein